MKIRSDHTDSESFDDARSPLRRRVLYSAAAAVAVFALVAVGWSATSPDEPDVPPSEPVLVTGTDDTRPERLSGNDPLTSESSDVEGEADPLDEVLVGPDGDPSVQPTPPGADPTGGADPVVANPGVDTVPPPTPPGAAPAPPQSSPGVNVEIIGPTCPPGLTCDGSTDPVYSTIPPGVLLPPPSGLPGGGNPNPGPARP